MLIEAFVQMRANQLAPDDEAQVKMPDTGRILISDLPTWPIYRSHSSGERRTLQRCRLVVLLLCTVGVACWSVVTGALKGLVGLEDLLQWLKGGARWWIRSTHVDWSL